MIKSNILQRHIRMKPMFDNLLSSKFWFKRQPAFGLSSVYVSAGPFNVSEVSMEHGHILSVITGAPFALNSQYHGKRQKRTVSLDCSLTCPQMWNFHDKYINEYLRYAFEYETPKQFRPKKGHAKTFTWRVREKFRMNPEYEMLFEEFMWDTHKGKFLPLTVNYNVKHPLSNIIVENYLHMIRLPFVWFKRRDRIAFDDRAADRWRWVKWWYYVITDLIEKKVLAYDAYLDNLYEQYESVFQVLESRPRMSRSQLNYIKVLMHKHSHRAALQLQKQKSIW